MEHTYIEKHDVVGRYLSGRLSDEELIRFEQHFLNCKQCVDQLETTEDIRCWLRTAAAEEDWLTLDGLTKERRYKLIAKYIFRALNETEKIGEIVCRRRPACSVGVLRQNLIRL